MSKARALVFLAVMMPLLGIIAACGGVTTTASVNQPLGGLNLASDTGTGAADGYVYIPVASLSRQLQPADIVISPDSTPPDENHRAAVGATVESTARAEGRALATTNSLGYYALLRLSPGSYDLTVTVEGVSRTVQITIEADSTTHATEAPSPDHPFAGFTRKHVDLSTNSTWQENHDRIESIDDTQLSFSATNNTGAPAVLDVFVSQNDSLTAVTIDDANTDDPPAYHIYHFSLPAGGPILVSSNADNTIAENQQQFRDQILSGNFYLYARVAPPEGGSFTISNVSLRLRLKLRVL